MKPLPAPDVPGNTPWEKMDNAVRKVFSVSKEALVKEEKKRERVRARKRAARPKSHK
jgi:hypothetical protein